MDVEPKAMIMDGVGGCVIEHGFGWPGLLHGYGLCYELAN